MLFRKNKRMTFSMMLLLCVLQNGLAQSVDDTPHFEKCIQWKRICEKTTDCEKEVQSRYGCYYCIKPGHYGFRIFPTQMKRISCNPKTVDYLRNMGYNCYKKQVKQYDGTPDCSHELRTVCESHCVQYAKEGK